MLLKQLKTLIASARDKRCVCIIF